MKVAALITLVFALASGYHIDVQSTRFDPRGMGFYGTRQTPRYMPTIKTKYGGNTLFQDMLFGQGMDMKEFRPLKSLDYEDIGMISKQGIDQLLLEIEQKIHQQQRFGNLDIEQLEATVSQMSENIIDRLAEVENSIFERAIQQIIQDKPILSMTYGSDEVQEIVKEQAVNVLKEIVNKITTRKMMEFQTMQKESLKKTLQAALAVEMLKHNLQQSGMLSVIDTSNFRNEVEKVLVQTILNDIEMAVEESEKMLKDNRNVIQLLKQQSQKIKVYDEAMKQQTEFTETLEKVKWQVSNQLQRLRISEIARRMVSITLQRLMVGQKFAMQQVSLQQVNDDMMRNDINMRMMQ